jgi:hypothetical protein
VIKKLLVSATAICILAAGCFFLWSLSSASGNAPECSLLVSLFAENIRCRWPLIAHYGFKLSLVLALASLLATLILRRRARNV